VTDYYYVDCERYREALSARLDDEEGPEDARHADDLHLEYCGDCALWYDQAALITRRTRTTAAVAWPDVTEAVLARVPATPPHRATRLRLALGAVGVAQGGTALFSLTFHDSLAPAAGYGTDAWNLALGVAFTAVAARRTQPGALVPLVAAFLGVLGWGHVTGLVAGEAGAGTAVSFALAALGLVLVVLLNRTPPMRRGPRPPLSSAARVPRITNSDTWGSGTQSIILRVEPTKAA
jgi:predicted anti-sigma-YlaC factor YlaD